MSAAPPHEPPRPRPHLTRAAVIEAAIAVIDERGVEGLSMRRLGTALGADPMAAYTHVANKAELLDAVVDHVAVRLTDLPAPRHTDPLENLVAFASHYRSVLLEHPNLAPLVASRPLPQGEAPAMVLFGVELLRAVGFADPDIPMAFDGLVSFSFGFVLQEAGRAQRRAELGVPFSVQQAEVLRQLAVLPGDTTVAQAVIERRLADDADRDEFETGLRAMLAGLRAGLGRPIG